MDDGEISVTDLLAELNELTLKPAAGADSKKLLPDHIYYIFLSLLELVDMLLYQSRTDLLNFSPNFSKSQSDSTTREVLNIDGKELWTEVATFGYTAAVSYNTGEFLYMSLGGIG